MLQDRPDTQVSYAKFTKFKNNPAYYDQIIDACIPNYRQLEDSQLFNCLLNAIMCTQEPERRLALLTKLRS